jgi:prepilin-type N-terminal cleavage/methylation domain-containing protein
MKKYQTVEGRESRVEGRKSEARRLAGPRPSTLDPRHAFTLIELLVVIAIMAALAALLLPVVGAVKKHQYIYNAQSEMAKLETAIDRYKAAYGFYPPDNHLTQTNQALINQLYYELVGTTNIAAPGNDPVYQTLDGRPPTLTGGTAGQVNQAFGVGGFMNCTKPRLETEPDCHHQQQCGGDRAHHRRRRAG